MRRGCRYTWHPLSWPTNKMNWFPVSCSLWPKSKHQTKILVKTVIKVISDLFPSLSEDADGTRKTGHNSYLDESPTPCVSLQLSWVPATDYTAFPDLTWQYLRYLWGWGWEAGERVKIGVQIKLTGPRGTILRQFLVSLSTRTAAHKQVAQGHLSPCSFHKTPNRPGLNEYQKGIQQARGCWVMSMQGFLVRWFSSLLSILDIIGLNHIEDRKRESSNPPLPRQEHPFLTVGSINRYLYS